MSNITKWFGYPIYITKLQDYEKINQIILPIILKEITPEDSKYSLTTDVVTKESKSLDDKLHLDSRFKSLFIQLSKVIRDCLSNQ